MTDDDERLKRDLLLFRTAFATAGGGKSPVSVTVDRRRQLTHVVTTPSGQTLRIDEPADFGGAGTTPDPAETLLGAIGASLSVTLTAYGALRDVSFDAVAVSLVASIDGSDFFEPGRGEPGLLDLCITLDVQTTATRQAVDELLRDVLRTAPVLASLKARPSVELVHRPAASRRSPAAPGSPERT